MKMKYRLICFFLIIAAVLLSAAEGDETDVLATNSWTRAFVLMAGGNAEQLAPSGMDHPPEYELKPSDVIKIREADLLVYAGYEVLMKTVFDSFRKPEEQLVQIATSYSPAVLETSVLKIAEKLETVDEARAALEDYKNRIAGAKKLLEAAGLSGARVLVHFHQRPLALALGFEIIGVFGPQPLEVRQIAEFGKLNPDVIIDNAHNPLAAPLCEILNIDALELVNFPGHLLDNGETVPASLTGVLEYNVNILTVYAGNIRRK